MERCRPFFIIKKIETCYFFIYDRPLDTYNEAFSMTVDLQELGDVIAQIKINHNTFELSLKNNFAVLSNAMMDDVLFPQTMNIVEIIHEHFGDVIIITDNETIFLPVSERHFCNITIE